MGYYGIDKLTAATVSHLVLVSALSSLGVLGAGECLALHGAVCSCTAVHYLDNLAVECCTSTPASVQAGLCGCSMSCELCCVQEDFVFASSWDITPQILCAAEDVPSSLREKRPMESSTARDMVAMAKAVYFNYNEHSFYRAKALLNAAEGKPACMLQFWDKELNLTKVSGRHWRQLI